MERTRSSCESVKKVQRAILINDFTPTNAQVGIIESNDTSRLS